MPRANKILLTFILLTSLLSIRQVFAADEPVSDVRILIDVSGSMKKNDPKNLRSPALEMIVGLLPEHSKAGVWTFAKYVNMLVPHKEVSKSWRADAEKQMNKIHSRGLFTNIEQALNKATANQSKANPQLRRSVILLSDGLVDTSKDPKTSIDSRKRILTDVVPRLKKANITVHTIALSGESDQALLREIALETDGWYEQVDDAEQLQRVFLHLFEKAAKRDNVPLTDNHFKIDDSISEMTVLVFRKADSKPTELLKPDQTKIGVMNEDSNVRWQHGESGYDLITITEPQVGAWTIDAELDPDNRVMVLTDLKLKTTDLPNNILIGEVFDFDVSLTNQDKVITKQNFLTLVNAKLTHENEIMDVVEEDLNGSQRKGNYRTQIGETFQPGRNDVVAVVTSGTFERQRRQSINVVETPFEITTEQLLDEATRTHRLTLKPDASLIEVNKTSIAAMLTAEDGSEWSYDVMKGSDNDWQLTLAELEPRQKYSLSLQIKSETLKGRALFLQPNLIELMDEGQSDIILPDSELTEEVTDELALLEQETDLEEGLDELMPSDVSMETDELLVTPDELVEEATDELSPLEELDELSPLDQLDVTDELGGDIDNLLPDTESDDFGLPDSEGQEDMINDENREVSTSMLIIGNAILLLLVVSGFFFWRRKMGTTQNPGAQL
jgi:uncharacterized protein (TIGR03503 family)